MKLKLMLLQVWSIFVPEGQHITALKVAAGRAISKITRQIIARRNGDRWRLLARRLLDRALVRVWSGVKAEVAGQREAVTAAEQAVLIAQREVEMLDAPDQEYQEDVSLWAADEAGDGQAAAAGQAGTAAHAAAPAAGAAAAGQWQ
jgi:hypothetical protein